LGDGYSLEREDKRIFKKGFEFEGYWIWDEE